MAFHVVEVLLSVATNLSKYVFLAERTKLSTLFLCLLKSSHFSLLIRARIAIAPITSLVSHRGVWGVLPSSFSVVHAVNDRHEDVIPNYHSITKTERMLLTVAIRFSSLPFWRSSYLLSLFICDTFESEDLSELISKVWADPPHQKMHGGCFLSIYAFYGFIIVIV